MVSSQLSSHFLKEDFSGIGLKDGFPNFRFKCIHLDEGQSNPNIEASLNETNI